MTLRHRLIEPLHLFERIYRHFFNGDQRRDERQSIDAQPDHHQICIEALLREEICQNQGSANITYFEFDEFFDDQPLELELFCESES